MNAIGIMHGLLESERDGYLRFFMQNKFEVRPDIAMDLTLKEYSGTIYTSPKKPQPEEHRDMVSVLHLYLNSTIDISMLMQL